MDRSTPLPAAAPKHVQMLQKDRHFQPHVLAVPVGSTVDFPNLDPIFHNAFSNFSGQPFDTGLYTPGTIRTPGLSRSPGIVRVFCNIHPTMSAIIAVLPTPWYVVTGPTGQFTIPNVPPGEYQLQHLLRARPARESPLSGAPHHGARRGPDAAPDLDFGDRLHSGAAPEQVREALSARPE